MHEKAHSGDVESRPDVLIRRTLPVRSFRLGLSGKPTSLSSIRSRVAGVEIQDAAGRWRPFPIEYKRSRDQWAAELTKHSCARKQSALKRC